MATVYFLDYFFEFFVFCLVSRCKTVCLENVITYFQNNLAYVYGVT